MKEYCFTEATPLIEFLDRNQSKIIGRRLKNFYIEVWPEYGRRVLSDRPVVLELEDCFIVINYLIPSDISMLVGTRNEVAQDKDVDEMIHIKDGFSDYYNQKFCHGVKKEEIENCRITKVEVQKFSCAFECNPITEEIRPEGGDYFSTIRLYLDSGSILCFCGADSMTDGYIEVWCK